jgi:hypothetical protein
MKIISSNVSWHTVEELKAMGPFDNIEIQISMRNKVARMAVTFDASRGSRTVAEVPWSEGGTMGQVATGVLGAALDEGLLSLTKPFTVNFLNLDGIGADAGAR